MKVKDFMTLNVLSVYQNDSIVDAAKKMKQANIGSLPVKDESQKVIGIITDRDIVIRSIADGSDIQSTTCGQVMSDDLVYVTPDMNIEEAAKIMSQNRIRRLPVVENGQPVGMLALGDIATSEYPNERVGETLSDISNPSKLAI